MLLVPEVVPVALGPVALGEAPADVPVPELVPELVWAIAAEAIFVLAAGGLWFLGRPGAAITPKGPLQPQ